MTHESFGRYAIALAVAALVLSALVLVLRPDADNLGAIAAFFAFAGSVLAILKNEQTRVTVNSQLDNWRREAKASSYAAGREAGRDEQERPKP